MVHALRNGDLVHHTQKYKRTDRQEQRGTTGPSAPVPVPVPVPVRNVILATTVPAGPVGGVAAQRWTFTMYQRPRRTCDGRTSV